ncbi:MAG: PTS transporter subunit EIIC, partial [Winkia neuii]
MDRKKRGAALRGKLFSLAQRLGRSLMLPIAVLPVAAIFVRFGQADMLGERGVGASISALIPVAEVLLAAGNAVIENLPLLFAVGVAIGFAKKSDGSTALAAIIGYFTFAGVLRTLSPHILGEPGALTEKQVACLRTASKYIPIDYQAKDAIGLCGIGGQELINYGVFGGILVGLVTAYLWARFYKTRLPSALAFFSGRRFVPLVVTSACLLLGVAMALIYPIFRTVFAEGLGVVMTQSNSAVASAGLFGLVQRLL